jgi:hypothetical protein
MTSQAELLMAEQLRQARIAFSAEVVSASPRRWRFDFAIDDTVSPIAVEIEGGTWSYGRHTRGKGYEDDLVKYNEAAVRGWVVLRFTTEMVEDGRALATIERAISRLRFDHGVMT